MREAPANQVDIAFLLRIGSTILLLPRSIWSAPPIRLDPKPLASPLADVILGAEENEFILNQFHDSAAGLCIELGDFPDKDQSFTPIASDVRRSTIR